MLKWLAISFLMVVMMACGCRASRVVKSERVSREWKADTVVHLRVAGDSVEREWWRGNDTESRTIGDTLVQRFRNIEVRTVVDTSRVWQKVVVKDTVIDHRVVIKERVVVRNRQAQNAPRERDWVVLIVIGVVVLYVIRTVVKTTLK